MKNLAEVESFRSPGCWGEDSDHKNGREASKADAPVPFSVAIRLMALLEIT